MESAGLGAPRKRRVRRAEALRKHDTLPYGARENPHPFRGAISVTVGFNPRRGGGSHAVFAVKYRASLIDSSWQDDLHQYIGGIIKSRGNKTLAVGGVCGSYTCFVWIASCAINIGNNAAY